MLYLAILEILFKGKDEKYLELLEKYISGKQESIKELRQTKNQKVQEYASLSMEVYILWYIFEDISNKNAHQKALQSKAKELLFAKIKLGHSLESIPWLKILNCKETQSEQLKKIEHRYRNMQLVYKNMESRNLVVEFRQEQRKNMKLAASLKQKELIFSKRYKNKQLVIDATLQNRNAVILKLVLGSKTLENLRLKLHEKRNKKQRSEDLQVKTMKRALLGTEKEVGLRFNKPMDITKSIVSTNTLVKPAKPSFNFRFNTSNFGINNAIVKNKSINRGPVFHNLFKKQHEPEQYQTNKEERVKVSGQGVSNYNNLRKSGNRERNTKATEGEGNISSQNVEGDVMFKRQKIIQKEYKLNKTENQANKNETVQGNNLKIISNTEKKSIGSDEKSLHLKGSNIIENLAEMETGILNKLKEQCEKSKQSLKKPNIPTETVLNPSKLTFNHRFNFSKVEKPNTKLDNNLFKSITAFRNLIKYQTEQKPDQSNKHESIKFKISDNSDKVCKVASKEKGKQTIGNEGNTVSEKMEVDNNETAQGKQLKLSSNENKKSTFVLEGSNNCENANSTNTVASKKPEEYCQKLKGILKKLNVPIETAFKPAKIPSYHCLNTSKVMKPNAKLNNNSLKSITDLRNLIKYRNEQGLHQSNIHELVKLNTSQRGNENNTLSEKMEVDKMFKKPEVMKKANITKKMENSSDNIETAQGKQLTPNSNDNEKSTKSVKNSVALEDWNISDDASSSESRFFEELYQNNENLEKLSIASMNHSKILQFSDVDLQSNFDGTISRESEFSDKPKSGGKSTYFL